LRDRQVENRSFQKKLFTGSVKVWCCRRSRTGELGFIRWVRSLAPSTCAEVGTIDCSGFRPRNNIFQICHGGKGGVCLVKFSQPLT